MCTYKNVKKLKSKKQIKQLFEDGSNISDFPLRLLFLESQSTALGIAVGKRNFKLAVQRNRIKRQMRAAAKVHLFGTIKELKKNYAFMLTYSGNELPNWNEMEEKLKNISLKLKEQL